LLPCLNLTLHLKPNLHEGLGPIDLGLNKVIQIYYLHELGPSHVNLMQVKCPKSHIYIYIYIFIYFPSTHFLSYLVQVTSCLVITFPISNPRKKGAQHFWCPYLFHDHPRVDNHFGIATCHKWTMCGIGDDVSFHDENKMFEK